MQTRSPSDAALLAAVLTAAVLAATVAATVPVALGADPARLPERTASLRAENASIEAQERAATLELYALETRLARSRATLVGIAARRSEVERERSATGRRVAVAQAALRGAEAQLGALARAAYQQGRTTDPLEVVLGATSLDEALDGLDDIDRAAGQSAEIVEQARTARLRLRAVQARLERRATELRQLAAAAEAETRAAAAAAAEREAYVASLRRRHELTATRVAAIEAQARAGAQTTAARAPAAAPPPAATVAPAATTTVAPVRAAAAGRTLTVTSTGYILRGRTSSGMPTGPGVAAVDPSVIPLGTRMTVPGYGEAIAADTGGSVVGNTIDLWFPTLAEAHRWGRRTVTITLH